MVRFITAHFCFYNMKLKITERVKACIPCQRAKIYRHIILPVASFSMLATGITALGETLSCVEIR